MRILLSFIQDNRLRLVDWFNQFDKDHSGGISREEFKTGLKETGLVMTQVSTVTNKSFCPRYYFVCNVKSCFIVSSYSVFVSLPICSDSWIGLQILQTSMMTEKLNTGNYGWDLFIECLTNCCKILGRSKQSQRTETVDLNQSKLEAEYVRNSYVQENTRKLNHGWF